MAKANATNPDIEDSASVPATQGNQGKKNSSVKQKKSSGGKNVKSPPSSSNASKDPTTSGPSNSQATGFAAGDSALLAYGLGVSGRKERILSPFKADKFFHIVEDSYKVLVDAKPHVAERFSLAEFRHCSALQLYQRLEAVKFDGLGIKPSAPTRIPLPRNLRVFQPLWSTLANIGIVDDDELRVNYIPDGILPTSEDKDSMDDIRNLLACTLYDWDSSWNAVLAARTSRTDYDLRDGYTADLDSNEAPEVTQESLIKDIADAKSRRKSALLSLQSGKRISRNGQDYSVIFKVKDGKTTPDIDEEATFKGNPLYTVEDYDARIKRLFTQAKDLKARKITPRFDKSYTIDAYQISDGTVSANPGAYGAWLHWDPQLWLSYEQFVEEVSGVAMFSASMPVETTGTYAWVVPVESHQGSADVFCKLPKASIPPVTWIFALILQSSTLNQFQRANFYVETDRLANVAGLRLRYIRKAITRGAPTEQYGTY